MSNMIGRTGGVATFDYSATISPEEAEHNVIVRSGELQAVLGQERGLQQQLAALEQQWDQVRHDIAAVRTALFELRNNRIPQARRELKFAFDRQQAVTPIPKVADPPTAAQSLAAAAPQPGGAYDQERTAAMAPGTGSGIDPKIAAQAAETRANYELTLQQIRARGIKVPSLEAEEKKAEQSAPKPAEQPTQEVK